MQTGKRAQCPQHWDAEADVVVLGYGAAGAVAAISAHDAGAGEVLVLEKQLPQGKFQLPLSSSYMSGGSVICPNNAEQAKQYMTSLYKIDDDLHWTDPAVIEAWAKNAAENGSWFEGIGGSMKFLRHGGEHKLPGWESIDVYGVPGMGAGLMRTLDQKVRERGIAVRYGTPGRHLITNPDGEVIGVKAQGGEKTVCVRSRRAVVLATGGFEFDEEMKLQYLRAYPTHFTGCSASTGDGIRMAQEIGAQLWHMNCCSARVAIKIPPVKQGMSAELGGRNSFNPNGTHKFKAGYIMVDCRGKRFTNENYKAHTLYYELMDLDSQATRFQKIPSYWIFDHVRLEDGPLVAKRTGAAGIAGLYAWSEDNSFELEQGWIKKGQTLQELAQQLGMEPDRLETTVREYNDCCAHGEDKQFNRPEASLIPLNTPPYYAIELWPGGPNTQGGPRRNEKAQVLRVDGEAIPRLYSAGELGSIYGMLYPTGGGNLAECMAFGRIAGENAGTCQPW